MSEIVRLSVAFTLRSPFMLPTLAVVDPDLLAGLPRAVIASSGVDALSQVIEPSLQNCAWSSTCTSPSTSVESHCGCVEHSPQASRTWMTEVWSGCTAATIAP